MTTDKTLIIDLAWTTDSNGLFASEADMTDVDVQASMAEYDGLLIAAVREAFPSAIVEHADVGGIWDTTGGDALNGADTSRAHRVGLVVQQLADDVLSRGDWIVAS
jgi:hypothetical protein